MTGEALLDRARALLIRTMTFYRDDPRTSTWLRGRLERLDQPLRIAVSGRVKAGKSTLINALVGTELAPTDAEERTQVTTFYQYGPEPKILVHTPQGTVQNVPVSTLDAGTIRDLQHWRPDEVSRLVIESPTPGLQAITLIETPGVASAAVQETGRSALAQILSEADAVLYLTRYPRQTDLQFLQSVNELHTARSVPISTIVAFSRADETGSGGPDGLQAAERIAEKFRNDPTLRSFAQHLIPVVGLLGQAVTTMTDEDFTALANLARLSQNDLEALLLSADRFVNSKIESIPGPIRQRLFERFGQFGLGRALTLLRSGVTEPKKLRTALLDESGLNSLHETVHQQFVERQDALRARSALLAVDMVLRANPRPGVQQLQGEFERMLANAHEWDELRLLSALDSGQVRFARPLQAEAKRLLGAFGSSPQERLGRDDGALAEEAAAALARWRQQSVNPLHDRVHRDAVRTVLRSCERLVVNQANAPQRPAQPRPSQQQPVQQPAQTGQHQQPAQQQRGRRSSEGQHRSGHHQVVQPQQVQQPRRRRAAHQAPQQAQHPQDPPGAHSRP
ncbi:Dynamin family protein [Saccharopolyspora antimicrobica]|uniref:Dynamin family protein n=1 Tax=Saccharopolyspora antimicrobica TaxID=455193 RepID=A0A1I5IN85_9PSEU|nr:dynamin family protein [Saccharopolyspora antimicrobica]RKT84069.1 dynamin family protein [Saccharopolyspora antimicrobica]SFO62017.1 Dynamin family protein [Saccharopolyspora antimicrobica]